jgi:hypothetical protein
LGPLQPVAISVRRDGRGAARARLKLSKLGK